MVLKDHLGETRRGILDGFLEEFPLELLENFLMEPLNVPEEHPKKFLEDRDIRWKTW